MKKKDLLAFKKELLAQRSPLITPPTMEPDDPGKGDSADMAAKDRQQELGLSLRERNRNKLKLIEAALERMEDGTYGLCEECEEPIPLGRLKSRPFAVHCVQCKSKQERGTGKGSHPDGGLLSEDIDVREFREDRD